uniref:Fibromodulin n=1 Tax=Lepisosteus oculatus TaxID=7918 RepID=W5N2Q9_LEPOC|nr:PREDICTED: fibromodulin [Lepisosteus oculatus]
MRLAALLLATGLYGLTLCQNQDNFFWLSYLRERWAGYNSFRGQDSVGSPGRECPLECDCLPSFPIAMYCDSRKLGHVPFVPSRMKYIYFQNNQITSIQDGVFDNATDLAWIMLHRNLLSTDNLGAKVFSNLLQLDRLYLDHNNLTRVPQGLPRSLRDLRLSNNRISKIQPASFEGMANLSVLLLNDNSIEEVGGALKGLTSLLLLDISNNKLKKLPDSLPEGLQQLYLEFNGIGSIPSDFFQRFAKLQYIRLSNNKLTDEGIPSNTFNFSSLIELDLSYNKLQKIPPVSTSLENLYLHANQIKEFSVSSFCSVIDIMNFSQLRVLRLDGNELAEGAVPAEAALCLRLAAIIDL